MNLAYFSPLNPLKSGISDFSEELISKLNEYCKITVFVDNYVPNSISKYADVSIRQMQDYEFEDVRSSFDAAVFHIGNNINYHKHIMDIFLKYGGILELHDVCLHNMIAADTIVTGKSGEYIDLMKYCHGQIGEKIAREFISNYALPPWEKDGLRFILCKHLCDRADAIIIHSDYAKQTLKAISPGKPIAFIPLHCGDEFPDPNALRMECRRHLGLSKELLVFGSFGYMTENKRVLQVLEALAVFKKSGRSFRYYIVGDADERLDILGKCSELGLDEYVIITGYTKYDEFMTYMGVCDFCINLRYPSQGETSASLHRMLGMGKPVIITDIAGYQEYPDEFALKVRYDEHEVDDILKALIKLSDSDKGRQRRGQAALEYANMNCSLTENAKKYARFFEQVIDNTWREDWPDVLVDALFAIDLADAEYISWLSERML